MRNGTCRRRFPLPTTRSVASILLLMLALLCALSVRAEDPDLAVPPWVQTGGPSGGVLNVVEIDPDAPNTLYTAGMGGSVFMTVDAGAHWEALPQIVDPDVDIYDLLLCPSDGTLVANARGWLFYSQDGGGQWQQVTLDAVVSQLAHGSGATPQWLAGTIDGLVHLSEGGVTSWREVGPGVPDTWVIDLKVSGPDQFWVALGSEQGSTLHRTVDGGAHWTAVPLMLQPEAQIHTLALDARDPDTLYVGLIHDDNICFELRDEYLYHTDNAGQSWAPLFLPGADAMVNAIGVPYGADALYVASGGTLWRSPDEGQTWEWVNPGLRNGDIYDLAVDPTNPSRLYVPRRSNGISRSDDAGQNWTPINVGVTNVSTSLLAVPAQGPESVAYASAVSGEGVFRTDNYGSTWTCTTDNGITHPWGDELAVNPHDPDEVWYVADVGEVFVSENRGGVWEKWIDTTGSGFRFGSTYAIGAAPSDADVLYALKNGFGIYRSYDGGHSWTFLRDSEVDYSYSIAVHPEDCDTLFSGYSRKPFQDFAMVRASDDAGQSWRTALHLPGAEAVTAVAIDPLHPQRVYAGATGDKGQVWRSDDGGTAWDLANEALTFTNVHVFAVDPLDSDVAYAGVWGGGTFRTDDAGLTWSELTEVPTSSAAAILVHPSQAGVVYVADRNAPRVYRSSDHGQTWTTWFEAGPGHYRVLAAALDSGGTDTVYASVFTFGGPMSGDLFRIRDGVGTSVTNGVPRLPVALATDPSSSGTVYAVLHGYGVLKTIDAGESWADISGAGSGLPQTPNMGYNALVVDPSNPGRLYLLGGCDIDMAFEPTGADPHDMLTVYRSLDGGAHWANLDDGNLGAAGGSIKGLAIAPSDPDVLYLGAAKGVLLSEDGGVTWDSVVAGMSYTETAGVAVSTDGLHLFAPTLGAGVLTADVSPANPVPSWDGFSTLQAAIYHVQIVPDASRAGHVYASAYPGGVLKSTDAGTTWFECNFGLPSFEIDDPNRQGYYALAPAPSDSSRVYLGMYGIGVYRSDDSGATWAPMSGTAATMRGKPITSLVVDQWNADVVYVGTEEGVYRSVDGGAHWETLWQGLDLSDVRSLAVDAAGYLLAGTRGNELYVLEEMAWRQLNAFGSFGVQWPIWDERPLYQYTTLLFHPTDPDVIYIGTFPAGIYKSVDGGATWRERNVGWTNDGVFCLVPHPDDPETVYAGTYNGVNRSTDGGAHWQMWDKGWPGEQWVFDIAFDPADPQIMYACSKNGENEGVGVPDHHGMVMKSVDGGANWFSIMNGVPTDNEFYAIKIDPYAPDTVYLATRFDGVMVSVDAGANWQMWNAGLTNWVSGTNGNNVTRNLALSDDGQFLYFGSAGSGVFRRMTLSQRARLSLPMIMRR